MPKKTPDSKQNFASSQITSETKAFSEKDELLNYEISAGYPELSGFENSDAQNKINQQIKDFVSRVVSDFKANVANACNFSDLPNPPDWKCELAVTFNGFFITNGKILSTEAEYYQFMGGAHGGTTFRFLNFDLGTGEKFDWQDAFRKDSDYLKKIAELSEDNLKQLLLNPPEPLSDYNWVKTGSEPNSENYNTNVGFRPEGLVVTFQQYQVAPYAAGPQQVVILYSSLKDVLDPNGPLAD